MRTMHDDPADLTPHQRLLELAAIFARGVRRLRARPSLDGVNIDASGSSQISAESPPDGLELPRDSRPDRGG